MSLADAAIKEVVDRHDGFVLWFTGRGDDTVMAAMEAVFPPGMVLISPDASIAEHAELMEMLWSARGQRAQDFAIRITAARALWTGEDAVLIAYVEHQSLGGVNTSRQSTALFTAAPGTPNGVVWRHVQETWIDKGDEPS